MKKTLVLLALVLYLPQTCSAQIEKFVNQSFDFAQVGTIYLVPLAVKDSILSTAGEMKNLEDTTFLPSNTTNDTGLERPLGIKQSEPFTSLPELFPLTWPQGYIKLLEDARAQADLIIFSDIIHYSSPPAYIEQLDLTPPTNISSPEELRQGGFSSNTSYSKVTPVPVFLPEGEFPALRFYISSSEELNVPVMSVYYKINTDSELVADNYQVYLDEVLTELFALIASEKAAAEVWQKN